MHKHQYAMSLIHLLARLGWQRDPDLWTVRCRDTRGRRAQLHVQLEEKGVTLTASSPGPWSLTPLEAGRLRGALRDALLSFDQLGNNTNNRSHQDRIVELPEPRAATPPVPRELVRLGPLTKPSTNTSGHRAEVPATYSSPARDRHSHEPPIQHLMAA